MNPDLALVLLGGLTPRQFMRQHWQHKPLLVRQAWPGVQPPLSRAALFRLVGLEGVESRLVERCSDGWRLRQGPLQRRALPALASREWTLLVQGLDLHVDAARRMLAPFRFVPEARLDDLMLSYASDGGGVGPHLDAYDVFLLQVHGQRRWRIGPVADRSLVPALPLRVLARFKPAQEWLLGPGDMLYLPPGWGHDGVAEGECMTCSIGFRAPHREELVRDLLARMADADELGSGPIYRDRQQAATTTPGLIPCSLRHFALAGVRRRVADEQALDQALGECLTEPKSRVWFEAGTRCRALRHGARLDRRTRMLYDDIHIFINGESFLASGRDAALMRELADHRCLDAGELGQLSKPARQLLEDWCQAGWLHDLE